MPTPLFNAEPRRFYRVRLSATRRGRDALTKPGIPEVQALFSGTRSSVILKALNIGGGP